MRRAPRTRFLLAAAGLTGLFWLAATPVFAGPATDRLRRVFSTGNAVLVEYRMYERRGRWLVRDVVVDGISTIDNYRAQFRRVLRQGSYAALIGQLRAKLGEDGLMFAQPSHVPTPAEVAASRPSPAPRVAARAPSSMPVARAAAPPIAVAPPVVKANTPAVVK